MEIYIGLDVSLASTAICVLGEKGKMVTEAQVASAPESLVAFMRDLPHEIAAIGLEAGPLSHWLHKGLTDAGFEAVLMETRQVKSALKAMPIKTDRRDAEGIRDACPLRALAGTLRSHDQKATAHRRSPS